MASAATEAEAAEAGPEHEGPSSSEPIEPRLARLSRTRAVLEQGVRDGLHHGAQLSVVLGDQHWGLCVGQAAPGEAMTPEHVLCWSSSVKPVLSLALGRLFERGVLTFQDPVSKHLPAFAAHGKQAVTITHLLTHTAGLWDSMRRLEEASAPPAKVLAHICQQPLAEDWVPGQRCGYDSPAWYVGAGVVAAADPARRAYETFVEEELFAPLGLRSTSIGMPPVRYEGLRASMRLAPLYQMGRERRNDWELVPGEGDPARVQYPCPAGNGRGPARELAALYASLLPRRADAILKESTVQLLTQSARAGLYDELQGTDTAWSLGFALRCVLSGRLASGRAFGHGGSQSSWAFADPEHDLAVACLCNGKPGPEAHYRRVGAVSTAVYEDLGLAATDGVARSFKLPMGMGTF